MEGAKQPAQQRVAHGGKQTYAASLLKSIKEEEKEAGEEGRLMKLCAKRRDMPA
jgi:hypothetical protein